MSTPKVFITTDLGGNDKDDAQSLIHTLLYANEIDIRGIGYTLIGDRGANPAPHQKAIFDAYETDRPNLIKAGGDWPTRVELENRSHMGETSGEWPGSISPAARAIIKEAKDASPDDPLYLMSWGPAHDLVRALHEEPSIAPNVRLITIDGRGQSAPTDPYDWLVSEIRQGDALGDLWWINMDSTFRGMYVGSKGQNDPTIHDDWVKSNAADHGALGELFAEKYAGGGISTMKGLKMGDTPSLLYVLDNVNNDSPGARSWGGSFEKNGIGRNTWSDKDGAQLGRYEGARTVYEHRDDILGDFARRLDLAKGSDSDPTPAPNEPAPAPERPGSSPDEATIGTGLTEIEDLSLSGYGHESRRDGSGGAVVRTPMNDDGNASGVFDGPSGTYEITVGYIDETDGASDWRLLVDGEAVKSWGGTMASSESAKNVSVEVALDKGDAITLEGNSHGLEFARLDWMRIEAADAPSVPPKPTPEPERPAPSPDAAEIGTGLTEIEDLSLFGYHHESRRDGSGDAVVRTLTDGDGSASGVFDGPSGTYEITVGYIDETDGASAWRLLVDGETVKSWDGTMASSERARTVSVEVSLDKGDAITLAGESHGLEFARLDWMRIEAADAPPKARALDAEPAAPARDASELDADLFVFAGQSNSAGHFYRRSGDDTAGMLGSEVFERGMEEWSGEDVRVVNAAVSSSGSNQYADSSSYWWDVDADKPGPELVRAMKTMREAEASGRDIDGLVWAQGEDDAAVVRDNGSNLEVTMQRFDEATRSTFDYIRAELDDPDLPIFIQELGDFPQDGGWLDGPIGALDAMRAVQSEIASDMPAVHLGARTTDIDAHRDSIHFSNEGYGKIAERLVESMTEVHSDEFLF